MGKSKKKNQKDASMPEDAPDIITEDFLPAEKQADETPISKPSEKRIDFDKIHSRIINMTGGTLADQYPEEDGVHKRINIKKASLSGGSFLNVEYSERILLISKGGANRKDIGGKIKRDGENIVHDDLSSAFKRLAIHLALIAELIDINDPALDDYFEKEGQKYKSIQEFLDEKIVDGLDGFTVTQFEIKNSGDNEGIILTGTRKLSTAKTLNLITPSEKWETSSYKYIMQLAEVIELCKYEAQLYLEGKMAPPSQAALDFEQQEADAETMDQK